MGAPTRVPPSTSWGTSRSKVEISRFSIVPIDLILAANLNVVYKPECSIMKEVRDQVLYLKCEVEAFPPNVTYYWYQNEHLISCELLFYFAVTRF